MRDGSRHVRNELIFGVIALITVVTLPAGILTAIFVNLTAAAVVFVVGWFLLLPVIPLLVFITRRLRGSTDGGDEETAADPVDELRDRYARGEIGDEEFTRRLDALLETDGLSASERTTTADGGEATEGGDEPAADGDVTAAEGDRQLEGE